jgi:flavin-dependent dehydrogenase
VNPGGQREVVVLGGGLAGLGLAIQLKRQDPATDVLVLERHAHPVPEAAFKVGESTVEIGAHYFAGVLGLREHLDAEQVRKFGFRFFFNHGGQAIDRSLELGVHRALPSPTWQLDRGRFENFLGRHARALGVEFRDRAMVRRIEPGTGGAPHRVEFEHGGERLAVQARWLVDASGRAGLLKRKLGLARDNDHDACAAWWRVRGLVRVDDWSGDARWQARCDPPERWRSTNHLCGPGYWAWLIPLASGSHSIGIVCDPALHPIDTINSHDKAMAWLQRHQPQLAHALAQGGHEVQDFAFLRRFSHGCTQVFSGADRWALTGEAGVFLDPFYSPGSDFIAIANTYACDLVARDRAGADPAPWAALWEQLYQSFYANTLVLYQDQYPLFGDRQVMPVKVVWDYTYYWAVLAPLFFGGRLTDAALLGRLRPQFLRAAALNAAMQPLLRDWCMRNAAQGAGPGIAGADGVPPMLDQSRLDWFVEMNRGLQDRLDDEEFAARIVANVDLMRSLALEILDRARSCHGELHDHGLVETGAGGAGRQGATASTGGPALLPPAWYGLQELAPEGDALAGSARA